MRIIYAFAALLPMVSGCNSSSDPIANLIKPASERVEPPASEWFVPPSTVVTMPVVEPVVTPEPVAEVVPPAPYVEPPIVGCQETWRNPCPHD